MSLTTKSPTAVVDAKLLYLVKKIVASNGPQQSTPPNVDYLVTILRTQHKEYLRKDLAVLQTQVKQVIQQLSATIKSTTGSGEDANNSNKMMMMPRKRKSRDADEEKESKEANILNNNSGNHHHHQNEQSDDEDEYDRAVAEQEAMREQAMTGHDDDGGGLNAALRERYKQVQKERDELAQQQQMKEQEEQAIMKESFLETANHGNEIPGAATDTRTAVPAAAAKRSPKKRKALLKRSVTNNQAPQNMDPILSQQPDFMTPVARPDERYTDLGGMDSVIQELRKLVEYPMIRPELYRHLGMDPPRGVLLRGPPGTGKSHLATAVAGELGVPFFRVSAPELVSGMSGESEGRIRDLFAAASSMAPALIFLDELDAIAPKRSDGASSRGMEKRMVAQLLLSMDMIRPQNNRNKAAVLVLAATNRPDALDPALRRAGRFDKEILMGVPDEAAREMILRSMTKDMRLSGDFDFKVLARKTPGYVGADIRSLAREAAVLAIDRIFHDVLSHQQDENQKESALLSVEGMEENRMSVAALTEEQMDPLYVTMDDFLKAVPLVQPSSKREGFATVPDVSWEAIGALESIRDELSISVLEPIRNPEKFQALGLTLPVGCLLYGPPGCGKTLLAKAIAHESGANFISVKGPELLDKYVGESERAVRQVFERARASSPCIVFFDELDSLVPKRGSDGGSGGGVSERVVNQLLTELDGLDGRRSVYVIGATNRPELIDSAMLRPGRLDRLLYVPLPTPSDRVSILKALAKGVSLSDDVDLEAIGNSHRSNGYSGADCAALMREAGLAVLKEDTAMKLNTPLESLQITVRHFDTAFGSVMPSVSKKDQARYDRMRDRMARARSRGDVADHGPVPGADELPDMPNEDRPPTAGAAC